MISLNQYSVDYYCYYFILTGYKTVELTDAQRQLRQEKAKRRREQANEKIENDKVCRLLILCC